MVDERLTGGLEAAKTLQALPQLPTEQAPRLLIERLQAAIEQLLGGSDPKEFFLQSSNKLTPVSRLT